MLNDVFPIMESILKKNENQVITLIGAKFADWIDTFEFNGLAEIKPRKNETGLQKLTNFF